VSIVAVLQILQNEVKVHEKNYRYVYETGQQLVNKRADGSDADKLRSDFDSLRRWGALVDAIDKRVDQCRSTIEQLKQYRVCLVYQIFMLKLIFTRQLSFVWYFDNIG